MAFTSPFSHSAGETRAQRVARRLCPERPTNDIRGAAYCPEPDRSVRRAVEQLLTEQDAGRRARVAGWTVAALVLVIVIAGGVRW